MSRKTILGLFPFLFVFPVLAELTENSVFGYTEPARQAQVAFAESGILQELKVMEGDVVAMGDLLAQLDVATLQHDLNIAREMLRLQEMRHVQMTILRKDGSVSPEEFERSQADLLVATERMNRTLAQIESRTLRAPFDGVVLKRYREISEHISAARPEVMTIAKLDELHVTLHVPVEAVEIYSLKETIPVLLEKTFHAEALVAFVSPVIDAASRTVRVRLEIANPDRKYRAGMLCYPQTPRP